MIYRTENLPYAAYLHSTHKLAFIKCERNGRRVSFIFDDPSDKGESLLIEFEMGAAAPVVAFYNSVRTLRRLMDVTKENKEYEYRRNPN